jgi:adenylate kinase family enzyme
MKIYVVGPVGSGKSTLAKRISKELDILYVELDSIIWRNDTKRDILDVEKKFNKILENDNWIIEDVGREAFNRGVGLADVVIYLNINRIVLGERIIKRWFLQRVGLEYSPYEVNFKMLIKMFKWRNLGLRKRKKYLSDLERNAKRLIILNRKQVNNFKGEMLQ